MGKLDEILAFYVRCVFNIILRLRVQTYKLTNLQTYIYNIYYYICKDFQRNNPKSSTKKQRVSSVQATKDVFLHKKQKYMASSGHFFNY